VLAPRVVPLLSLSSLVAAARWPVGDHDLGDPINPTNMAYSTPRTHYTINS
jgi:hypothetical protein